MEDLTGRQLGPYQIEGPLGEGGMAAVYKAYQPNMDRRVALKVLPRQLANDPSFVARFDQEARIIAKLQHVHIVPVYDYGRDQGYTYLVMPFIPTGTLADVMRAGNLPLDRIRTIILQVGEALGYAHAQGVIHRDVKPSNILVDDRGNCRLTDFGIAKMVEGTLHLTQTGAMSGTPSYMSPEQIQGGTLDGRSDLYSLGVILFEMATGRPPFLAETPAAVLVKHLHDRPPNPRSIRRDLAPPLERLILKSLAKAREERHPDAASFVQAVKAAIPETPGAKPRLAPSRAMGTMKASAGRAPLQSATTVVGGAAERARPRILLVGGPVLALLIVGGIATLVIPDLRGRFALVGQPPSSQVLDASLISGGGSSTAPPLSSDLPVPTPTLEPSATPAPTQVSLTEDQIRRMDLRQRLLDVRAWTYQGPGNLYVHFTDTADRDRVNQYDPATLELVRSVVVGVDALRLDLSPDGSRLMLVTASGELVLWNTDEVAPRDQSGSASSSWSPDGQLFILTGPADVAVWDPDAVDPLWVDRFPGNYSTVATWSPDSRQVATNWGSRTVLADAETGVHRGVLQHSGTGRPGSLAWHPDGQRLAVGIGAYADTHVEVWDATDRLLEISFPNLHTRSIIALAWSPDGRLVASASADGTILTWDPKVAQVAGRFAPLAGPMSSVAWSLDGTYLAGGTSGQILIWDAVSGVLLARLPERSPEDFPSPISVQSLIWLPHNAGLISIVNGPGFADFISLWAVPNP